MLGFRIEELAGGGDGFGRCVAIFLAAVDVFAAVDALGFRLGARNRGRHMDFDFRMHGDGDLVLANGLDWRVEQNLRTVQCNAVGFQRGHDITHRDRTVELTGFRRLTDDDDVAAVDLLGNLGGFAFGLNVLGLQLGFHAVVLLAVFLGRAQGLVALEQEVTGKAVLHFDHIAHLAELGHAFQ